MKVKQTFMSLEKNNDEIVWLVLYTKHSIEIVGVFTSKELAESHCKDSFYVVGPLTLDSDYEEIKNWDGAYRPHGGDLYPTQCSCEECNC